MAKMVADKDAEVRKAREELAVVEKELLELNLESEKRDLEAGELI